MPDRGRSRVVRVKVMKVEEGKMVEEARAGLEELYRRGQCVLYKLCGNSQQYHN